MKQKSRWADSIKSFLQESFAGSRNMSGSQKELFHRELLRTTQKRTQLSLGLIIALQILKISLDLTTQLNMTHFLHFREGAIVFIVISVLFLILLFSYRNSANYRLRFIIVYGCWTMLLISATIASYFDIIIYGSISYYTIFIIAMGIIPIMQFGIGISYLFGYFIVNIVFATSFDLPNYALSHLIIFTALAFLSYFFQYSFAVKVFNERRQLKNYNLSLRKLSETDPLTGLLNRRGMIKALKSGFGIRREGDTNILLILIDIDHFKEFNDKYLHIAGDQCLKKIASSLQDCASRNIDVVARFGGEEFVIAVYNTTTENIIDYGLSIIQAVRDLQIPLTLDIDLPFVTISAGLVLKRIEDKQPLENQLIDELISQADTQMYNAKTNGRNCISFQNEIYR